MNWSRLFSDERYRAKEFPVVRRRAFLAHAAVCALPARVSRALSDHARRAEEAGQDRDDYEERLDDCRRALARLMGRSRDEISFVPSTSHGLDAVARMIEWKTGDEIVCRADDYPTNSLVWSALERRGVKRVALDAKGGVLSAGRIATALSPRTRLVALPGVHHLTGERADLVAVGAACRARGVPLAVDAVQGLGAWRLPGASVDFAAASAYKWLLGPLGIGVLFVRRGTRTAALPPLLGWANASRGRGGRIEARRGAGRHEPGGQNLAGVVGLRAALGLLEEAGEARVEKRLRDSGLFLRGALERAGWSVLGNAASGSSIVSFRAEGANMARVAAALSRAGVEASLRDDAAGATFVRLSPHFYNTDGELARAVAAIGAPPRRSSL